MEIEMLEVVTKDGHPTGKVLGYDEVHHQELWHRDVHVWVTNGKQFLQQQRGHTAALMPGEWDISVGGHVAFNESTLTSGVRETGEELNLFRPAKAFKQFGSLAVDMYIAELDWHHRVFGDNYVLYEPGLRLQDLQPDPREVVDMRFYNIDQLEQDLRSPKTANHHAQQPRELWMLGINAMRQAAK